MRRPFVEVSLHQLLNRGSDVWDHRPRCDFGDRSKSEKDLGETVELLVWLIESKRFLFLRVPLPPLGERLQIRINRRARAVRRASLEVLEHTTELRETNIEVCEIAG